MRRTLMAVLGLALAAPASAQDPPAWSIRPFVMGTPLGGCQIRPADAA